MQKVEPPQIAKKPSSTSLERMERSRPLTGVICDKKAPIKLKHKIYKTVIRPTMTYVAEC